MMSWGSVMVEGRVMPRREGVSLILKDNHFKALSAALPVRLRVGGWVLLYSSSRDGTSLSTLYRKVAKRGPTLIVVRDGQQHIFGGFTSADWKVCPRYYGNGECFVYQVEPEMKAYRWTRANSYFMYSTATLLAMGGGAHCAILMNSDLLTGSTGECETYGNSTLASSEEFKVHQVEVWGFR